MVKEAAFPYEHTWGNCSEGMTLRDYFAGQALNGVVAIELSRALREGGEPTLRQIAGSCYAYADAMLKARGE